MGPSSASVDERLERIERLLSELVTEKSPAHKRGAPPRVYRKPEAARLLRVDRATTLERMIRTGQILSLIHI